MERWFDKLTMSGFRTLHQPRMALYNGYSTIRKRNCNADHAHNH